MTFSTPIYGSEVCGAEPTTTVATSAGDDKNITVESPLPEALGLFSCPNDTFTEEHTRCCEKTVLGDDGLNTTEWSCCKPEPVEVLPDFIDNLINSWSGVCRVAVIISFVAIGLLFLAGLIIVVCCLCSGCPLYNVCRKKYDNTTDIIATAGEEEAGKLADMPIEDKDGVKNFAPNEVKMTALTEEQQPLVDKENAEANDKKDDKKKDSKKKKEEEKKKKEEEKKKKEEEKKKKEEEKKKEKEQSKKKDEKKEEPAAVENNVAETEEKKPESDKPKETEPKTEEVPEKKEVPSEKPAEDTKTSEN